MYISRKIKIGPFLVIASVLTAWALLVARPVQAQVAPSAPPGCPSSSIIRNIAADATATVDDTGDTLTGALKNDNDPDTPADERVRTLYFKLTVPALTAGELTVSTSDTGTRTVGRLCRGSSSLVVHPRTATGPDDTDEFNFEANMVPVTPGDYYVVVSGQNVDEDGARQTGPEEGEVSLTVTFTGVRPTTAGTSAVGSLSSRGELDSYGLTTTSTGLLTVKTTGSTDTKGMFTGTDSTGDMNVEAEAGGSGGNFQIIAPVAVGAKTVSVQGQTATTTGDYTLDVGFNVAETLDVTGLADATPVTDSDGNDIKSGEADYFFFTVASGKYGLMTIQTKKHTSITASGSGTNTRGTLYGPKGLITTDDNSGDGGNFKLSAPIAEGNYIVKVEGQSAGPYTLEISINEVTSVAPGTTHPAPGTAAVLVTAPGAGEQPHVARYQIAVPSAGTLQVLTTGTVDTVGTLYGPDGREIVTNEDGGKDKNFKITRYVEMPGNYLVVVAAADRTTNGSYRLQTGFIEGVEVRTGTGTGTGTVADLEARIDELEEDLRECRGDTVTTDARGNLGNPSGGGFRSGVGVISGWVCAANEVEVRIFNSRGSLVRTLAVAYGTSRPDVPLNSGCTNPNAGFGATFNFNHLPEGQYTIRAYADGTDNQIGGDETFEVVHLREFEATDTDRFLRLSEEVEARGQCRVPDFPAAGEDTFLRWEQSIQNFVIEDAG